MKLHAHSPRRPTVAHGERSPSLRWRRLRLADADALRAFFGAQSAADRRLRFHAAVKEISGLWLDHLLNPGDPPHWAFAATMGSAEGAALVAEAVMAFDADGTGAEIGMMVDVAWRGRGVGAWCLKQIEREAQARRIRCLRADVLPGNDAMLALLRHCGFEPDSDANDDLHGPLVLRLDTAEAHSRASRCLPPTCAGIAAFQKVRNAVVGSKLGQ